MGTYTYDISEFLSLDVADVVNFTLLTDEINASSITSSTLLDTGRVGDDISIFFVGALSEPDQITLGAIVANHTGTPPEAPGPGEEPPAEVASSVQVKDEGSDLADTPHLCLNFAGAGVAATNAGDGVALITIGATGGDNASEDFTKTSHGFAVGDVVRHAGPNAADWVKAQADSEDNSEALGVIASVTGDDFTITYSGRIDGLTGLTAGSVHFLDASTAGALTTTEPAISKPILFATSTTEAVITIFRGMTGDAGTSLVVEDEGTPLTTSATKLNFAGTGVTVTEPVADEMLVTIPGYAPVDEDKIIYVGKHGDNGNDGRTISKAVLTFGQALTLVAAETPSSSNIWGIGCNDGGVYTEDLSVPSFVHLFASNASLVGGVTLADDCSVEFENIEKTSGTAITKSSGAGTAYLQVKKLETSGTANGILNSSGGILNTEIEFFSQTGGVGLSNTGTSITHADIQDWDLYGASPVAVSTAGGMVNLRAANIADRAGTGTSVAFDCNGGVTNSLSVYVATDTLLDVEAGATLNLIGASVTGTQLNDGTLNLASAGAPIFGSEFQKAESLGPSVTNSNTYVEKLRLTTTALPPGDYIINWSFDIGGDADNKTVLARVQHNDATTLMEYDSLTDGDVLGVTHQGGHAILTLSGVDTFDIDYAKGGGDAKIKNARLTLWRVA